MHSNTPQSANPNDPLSRKIPRNRKIRLWLRKLFHVEQFDRELNAELQFHVEQQTERNIRNGMGPAEARRAALREFGGMDLAKEECRDEHPSQLLGQFWRDVRFGLRMLRKNPGFTAVAVLTIALGIGANTAIFSVVSAVLLRPLPYPNHAQLVHVHETHFGSEASTNFSYANFLDLQRSAKTLENVAGYRPWTFNLTGAGDAEQVFGAQVSANFFSALGIQPFLGRMIDAADDSVGGDNHVVVLSYALWQSHFGGDPQVIGKTTDVNSQRYVVIGVTPQNFKLPDYAEMWSPLVPGGKLHDNRSSRLLTVIANLGGGKTLTAARSELSSVAAQIQSDNPGGAPGLAITAIPLKESVVAPVRPALMTLVIAVGLLLLIACANVANLLLARGATRKKEIATRIALGAGRARLISQLLTESVMIASLGGALGCGIAWWSLRFIVALNGDFPRFGEITLDWRVLVFTLFISFLTGIIFGVAPALANLKLDLNTSLKERAPISSSVRRGGISQPLVALQFALAMLLLIGAGLLGRSFVRLVNVNPGFNSENLLTMRVFLSPVRFPENDPKAAVVLRQMLEQIRAIPGVRSAGLVNTLPITGGAATDFVIQGRPAPLPRNEPVANINIVDSGYFRAIGIPLIAGREFTENDTQQSARVMIINQSMAKEFWPNESPIGQRVTMKNWGPPLTGEVVGIVGDTKADGIAANIYPMIYWPYFQFPQNFNAFVVRAESDPARLVAPIKERIWSVDKTLPISGIATMDQLISDSLAQRRLYMILLTVFAGAALLLAAVGIYGVMSYSVSQRTNEMGIRIALGAQAKDVLLLIMKRGLSVALAGMAIGIAAAFALTRLMSSLLYGVAATDPFAFCAVATLMMLVALFGCYLPARRATRVDPITALRID
jgi:putative ABC transport system permease protein